MFSMNRRDIPGHLLKYFRPRRVYKPKDDAMIPHRVYDALMADGWYGRSDITWAKGLSFCESYSGSVMPESARDRPTSAHEHLFLLAKAPRYYYDAEAVAEQSIHAGRVVSYDGTQKNTAHENRTYPGAKPRDIDVAPTRNLRNVWAINPAAFPEAHFATFPPALVEPCVKAGASERGCCPRCGAPWRRVMKKSGGTTGKGWHSHEQDLHRGQRGGDERNVAAEAWRDGTYRVSTLGWRPTCECPEHEPVPCVVLDPFAGAGTALLVADRLGRRGVGVEISEDYCRMAYERLYNDAPLLVYAEGDT